MVYRLLHLCLAVVSGSLGIGLVLFSVVSTTRHYGRYLALGVLLLVVFIVAVNWCLSDLTSVPMQFGSIFGSGSV
jgi:hypothetical protein